MTTQSTRRSIALVPSFDQADANFFAKVAQALEKQVNQDFSTTWKIDADVKFFPRGADYGTRWPIIVTKQYDGLGNALGIHMHPPENDPNQPFAIVRYSDDGSWSLTASHECLEMLADSSTDKTARAISPLGDAGEISREVCDPVQWPAYGYLIDNVRVSDFCTPAYYDEDRPPPYDHRGKVKQRGQVLQNGYLAWTDPKMPEYLFIKENVPLQIFKWPVRWAYVDKFLVLDASGCAMFWTIPWWAATKLELLSHVVRGWPLGVLSSGLGSLISTLSANVRARAFGKRTL